jgi:WD40 repeat protein
MILLTVASLLWQDSYTELGNRRNTISSVAFHSAGRVLIYSGNAEGISIYSVETKEDFGQLGRSYPRGAVLSKDGRYAASLVTGSGRRAGMSLAQVTVWDFDLRRELRVFEYDTRTFFGGRLAISPDSQFVACAEYDEMTTTFPKDGIPGGRLSVWTLAEGRQVHLIKGDFVALDFSPDSKLLAVCDRSRTAKLLSLGTGKPVQNWTLPLGNINAVRFSPDGQFLAAACVDHDLRLWNPKNGKLVRTLSGHSLECTDVAFLSDGKTLITTGADESARFWDVSSGKERKVLKGFSKGALCVAVHPGDSQVAIGCGDGVVRLFDMPALDK